MSNRRDDVVTQFIGQVVAADSTGADRDAEDQEGLAGFLHSYYRYAAPEDLLDHEPAHLLSAALSHRGLAEQRPPGRAAVRVLCAGSDPRRGVGAGTVVEIVTDDMPFLVDTVAAELIRHGLSIDQVLHPQLPVRRDNSGTLLEVPAVGGANGDRVIESWIRVKIGGRSEPANPAQLSAGLQSVLTDLRRAVEDWLPMQERAWAVADELTKSPPTGIDPGEINEASEVLRFLASDHFTFVRYREYVLEQQSDETFLRAVEGSELGVAADDDPESYPMPPEPAQASQTPRLMIITKAERRSTVHRHSYLDCIRIRAFDDKGTVVGERHFLGLFASTAYIESVLRIPMLRRKARLVLQASGYSPASHSGRDLMNILETYPRDELFAGDVTELQHLALGVLHVQERRQLRLFLRYDGPGQYISALIYLPRDLYTTKVRLRMERILRDAFDTSSVDYSARVSESLLARFHAILRTRTGQPPPEVDPQELERRLAEAARSWTEDFAAALHSRADGLEAARMLRAYPDPFPEAYKEDFSPHAGIDDLCRIDALSSGADLSLKIYAPLGTAATERRLKLFSPEPLSLSQILPTLQHLGVEVTDERPYEITRGDRATSWIYDFGLRHPAGDGTAFDSIADQFCEAFLAVWSGHADDDGFNALVTRAHLTWRQVVMLRAYAKYLHQAGTTFGQNSLQTCLQDHWKITKLLVELFEVRFDPDREQSRAASIDALVNQVRTALDAVASLDEDRMLRAYLTVIEGTTRTNYFQPDSGQPKPYLSFKLTPRALHFLPEPRPRHEIWVYSPRVEGTHLRYGAVARGGLRWSDRRDDFRTEVLGLVKAQMVKNSVIVPVGAKGGFVAKCLPDPAIDRKAWLAEGVACYRIFLSGLLDLTDNLVRGHIEPPTHVVRHDDDDPYLVVAADKGTATFSDIANGLAADYSFWLGDAFASGGSAGYDHKAMGITARGAWESVKRHFREIGMDTQSEDFTVVGIGDMSGDVFGNGMLLSEHIRLVAAFDHRHNFLDPDPDPAASYDERRRLFDLPRSTWADYNLDVLSSGGGIYPRALKAVPISTQVRDRLRIHTDVAYLTPAQLIRAILLAPADLLWNGGIGTFVKASTETHLDVGDKANEAIRVDGIELACRVVGEGGNLGLTQRGRIEYAVSGAGGTGGRINTDAIDNAAGDDTSHHEDNIKILLDRWVSSGEVASELRNNLLAEMTGEVANLVLKNNYQQNLALSISRHRAAATLPVHRRFLAYLESRGELDRELEFLPADPALAKLAAEGRGLSSPELSVLTAYAKISVTEQLLTTDLADGPWFAQVLCDYFPQRVARVCRLGLPDHPLRREIVTVSLVNDMIDRLGSVFVFRVQEETGAEPAQIARAYAVARAVFGLGEYFSSVESLGIEVPVPALIALHRRGQRLLDRGVRWLLQSRHAVLDVGSEIARFAPHVSMLARRIPDLLRGDEHARLRRVAESYEGLGAPPALALTAATLLDAYALLDIVEIAEQTQQTPERVARVYFTLSERFEADRLVTLITALPSADRWPAMARAALRNDLYAALANLTSEVIESDVTSGRTDPDDLVNHWERLHIEGLTRTRMTLADIATTDTWDLAALSVALQTIRTLVRS
jgi:glutamate dehydrogenase